MTLYYITLTSEPNRARGANSNAASRQVGVAEHVGERAPSRGECARKFEVKGLEPAFTVTATEGRPAQ